MLIQTSATLASVLYNLAKNPDKQEKLREEVFKILPTKETKLDASSLDHVPYLRAVIKESLRKNPIFSGNARAAEYDLVLQGYQVPKGVSFINLKFFKQSFQLTNFSEETAIWRRNQLKHCYKNLFKIKKVVNFISN